MIRVGDGLWCRPRAVAHRFAADRDVVLDRDGHAGERQTLQRVKRRGLLERPLAAQLLERANLRIDGGNARQMRLDDVGRCDAAGADLRGQLRGRLSNERG